MSENDKPRGVLRRLDTEEDRRFWSAVDAAAAEVRTWPGWKRGVSTLPAYQLHPAIEAAQDLLEGLQELAGTLDAAQPGPSKRSTLANVREAARSVERGLESLLEALAAQRHVEPQESLEGTACAYCLRTACAGCYSQLR